MGTPPPRTREHSDYTKLNLHSLETWDGWRQLHKQKTWHVILGFVKVLFCFKLEPLRAQACWLTLYQQQQTETFWLVTQFSTSAIHLGTVHDTVWLNTKWPHSWLHFHASSAHDIVHWYRQLDTKWLHSWLCFPDVIVHDIVHWYRQLDTKSWLCFHDVIVHDIVHWYRQLDTKWLHSWLCFHEVIVHDIVFSWCHCSWHCPLIQTAGHKVAALMVVFSWRHCSWHCPLIVIQTAWHKMTLSTDADGWTQNGHSHSCVFTTFKH